MIDFQTNPARYQHWTINYDGAVATLSMDVNPTATLAEGYELKLNSYDLGVDIELYDAVQRLRFEHPEIKTVILDSANEKIFCAGANITMLGVSSHAHKVNFCKFTNETRNSIEDASENSQQRYLCAVKGIAAGGGYELALATDHIMLADDGNSAVSLPEVPLLAVLPGTGGFTRVTDKRKVRRDYADVFCTLEEGVRGPRARQWRLVDEVIPGSKFKQAVQERALEIAKTSDRPDDAVGIELSALEKDLQENKITYPHLSVEIDRKQRVATLVLSTPTTNPAGLTLDEAESQGADFWPLAMCRELDDAILHLRSNENEIGILVFKTQGDMDVLETYNEFVSKNKNHWLMREIQLYWRRTLKRVDLSSRSTLAFIEQGSCFAGVFAELLFSVDRSYMLEDAFEGDDRPAPSIRLSAENFTSWSMSNGISRLQTRFWGEPDSVEKCREVIGKNLDAQACEQLGLVTYVIDSLDWHDELRVLIEERASYSPDCSTGMEANLRFTGPETMETKIFGRLT
ncbi:MAG: 2,3-epoxybenzoyl-CoA dihydrolase, partial [Spongiibacteraceae bacterium]|nr:2,3-epoxybenzoyl-CoA dihydrolase [Spongiibacteraceae bacterium]